MITRVFLIIVVLAHMTKPQHLHQPNRTLWSNDGWVSGANNYEKVKVVEPKFKSKQLAGLVDWYRDPGLESGAGQTRHLEWFEGSDDDSESAGTTEKGLLAELFGGDSDDDNDDLAAEDNDLRQHHRKKYVKVNKVLLPLLMAYKLKFFTMIPLLIGALVLLVTTTGLAGFFFALFAAAAGLHVKKGNH